MADPASLEKCWRATGARRQTASSSEVQERGVGRDTAAWKASRVAAGLLLGGDGQPPALASGHSMAGDEGTWGSAQAVTRIALELERSQMGRLSWEILVAQGESCSSVRTWPHAQTPSTGGGSSCCLCVWAAAGTARSALVPQCKKDAGKLGLK